MRPNVPWTEPGPAGWQRELQAFPHGASFSLEEVQDRLRALGELIWEDVAHDAFSSAELRGHTGTLKFALTCPSLAGMGKATPDQLDAVLRALQQLRTEIWG